jgi:hypothetical protein
MSIGRKVFADFPNSLAAAPLMRNTAFISYSYFGGKLMPEILEAVLWCAALAAWLMLLCGFITAALRPLAKSIRRVLAIRLKTPENRRTR